MSEMQDTYYYKGKEHVAKFPVSTQEWIRGKEIAMQAALERRDTRDRQARAWSVEEELRRGRGAPEWYVRIARLEAEVARAEMRVAIAFARECELRIRLAMEPGDEPKREIDACHEAMNEESARIWEGSELIRKAWETKGMPYPEDMKEMVRWR